MQPDARRRASPTSVASASSLSLPYSGSTADAVKRSLAQRSTTRQSYFNPRGGGGQLGRATWRHQLAHCACIYRYSYSPHRRRRRRRAIPASLLIATYSQHNCAEKHTHTNTGRRRRRRPSRPVTRSRHSASARATTTCPGRRLDTCSRDDDDDSSDDKYPQIDSLSTHTHTSTLPVAKAQRCATTFCATSAVARQLKRITRPTVDYTQEIENSTSFHSWRK